MKVIKYNKFYILYVDTRTYMRIIRTLLMKHTQHVQRTTTQ